MHSARLLFIVFYLTPIAAIICYTLSERLPKYHRVQFPEFTKFYQIETSEVLHQQKARDIFCLALLKFQRFVGYFDSYLSPSLQIIPVAMSTRYWDEIDWYIQEGAQQLCEMLNSENEDASSSKWSTGEEDDEIVKENKPEKTENEEDVKTEDTAKKFDDLSVKDEVSDGDSVKDEEDYMERSTSVDDENSVILKQQTKVDELLSLCTKCGMLPPIYTYFTTGDEQVVSTVQLWNGVRFSSHSQISRDKAMEEAAGHALSYLKGELRENRPVSTSPPSTLPYYLPVQNLIQPQYYAHQAAYASRVPYAPGSAQPYFIPSVPYTMLPPTPVVTIASDYQQAAMIHPQFRFNPQYAPYVHQYPFVQLQASPTRQLKDASIYHGFSAKPVVWTNYPKDSYAVQDKPNAPRTEYKLLDEPPTASAPKTEEQHENLQTKEIATPKKNIEKAREERKPNKVAVTTQKRQGAIKPKLAISFKKD